MPGFPHYPSPNGCHGTTKISCCYGIFLLTHPDKYTMNLLAIEQREIPNNSAHKTLWKMTPFPNLLTERGWRNLSH